MADMLVKLYELKDDWDFVDSQEKLGITIRKPIGPEKQLVRVEVYDLDEANRALFRLKSGIFSASWVSDGPTTSGPNSRPGWHDPFN